MKNHLLLLASILTFTMNAQLINEFEPNPLGSDPSSVSMEIKGSPGASFSGVVVSIDSDGADGNVDRLTAVTGNFDANGLLVVSVPDFENPSFTVILAASFSGNLGDDLDTDDNGQIDDTSVFTSVYDAILIPDSLADATATSYATQLGGISLSFSNDFPISEPYLLFRDTFNNEIFTVYTGGSPTRTEIFDSNGTNMTSSFSASAFNSSFGEVNATNNNITLSNNNLKEKLDMLRLFSSKGKIKSSQGNITRVFNAQGQKVLNENLVSGVYIVIVVINEQTQPVKFILND